jgi:hypothetical protein
VACSAGSSRRAESPLRSLVRASSLAALLALAATLAQAADDVVILANGDHISGKVVAKGTKFLRFQTPYGLLAINIGKVERIQRADGTEEVLNPLPQPVATPPPPPPRALSVILQVTGKTFWQAWDAAAVPADPTLRLEVRLDDRPLASYLDAKMDGGEIPKAVVNSFSFTTDSLKIQPAPGTKALFPEIKTGRIQLPLEVAGDLAGAHRLRIAYQTNDGNPESPQWRDLASAETTVTLQADGPTTVRIEQERGSMEFSKRRMKNVETFQLALKLDTPTPEP